MNTVSTPNTRQGVGDLRLWLERPFNIYFLFIFHSLLFYIESLRSVLKTKFCTTPNKAKIGSCSLRIIVEPNGSQFHSH